MLRLGIAIVVSPLVPSLLFALATAVFAYPGFLVAGLGEVALSIYILLFFSLIASYAATLVVGVPLYMALRKLGLLSARSLILATITIGAALGICTGLLFGASAPVDFIASALGFALLGATAGGTFWALTRRTSHA
jgi:hypothetical protein